ncbi:MAG: type III secretion system export apparatus subunit SctT [Hyphomicrobiales bacterium]|nr:type III secretion system export apparatus subunit SctT [Hyphomicrobiales bacterium]
MFALETDVIDAVLLTLPRLLGMALFLPFFRAPLVPALVRNAVLLSIALVVLPVGFDSIQALSASTTPYWLLAIKEFGVGMLFGFLIGLTFLVPQIIGDYLDNQRGASIASLFNPTVGGQSSNLGLLLGQIFLVWFLVSGGMEALYGVVLQSYRVYPINAPLPVIDESAVDALLALFSKFIKLALLLAAPAAFVMLLAEFGLGLVSRFAPQLNVFFLAMPLKSVLALLIVGLTLSVILTQLWESGLIFAPARGLLEALAK